MPELKLVIPSPIAVQENSTSFQSTPYGTEFRVDVKNRGSQLYEMTLQDHFHHLKCNLLLEIEENQYKNKLKRIICHFPSICDEQLEEFTEEDDILYWVFMIRFQMKVLEQLLLFCSNCNVSQLIIYTDDMQVGKAGVYQGFLIHLIGHDQVFRKNDEQTKFVIPSNPETFDAWIRFMQEINIKLGQELWRNQRSSPVIQRYLKASTRW